MDRHKKWFLGTIIGSISILMTILLAMVIFDPYFHYHGMIPGMSYRIYNERYINSGIVKNFEYDAIITGSSMNQNFKTSQMDELWGTNSIKVTFSGAGFQEIKNNLVKALESGKQLSSSEIAKVSGFTKTKTLRLLDALKEKGYVKMKGNGRGTKYSL